MRIISCDCWKKYEDYNVYDTHIEDTREGVNIYVDKIYRDRQGYCNNIRKVIIQKAKYCQHCGRELKVGK